MPTRAFVCTPVEPFDLFRLGEVVGVSAEEGDVEVTVRHPDREADGSCRWCGCREDEVVTVRTP